MKEIFDKKQCGQHLKKKRKKKTQKTWYIWNKSITEKFNEFFVNVEPNLTTKTPPSDRSSKWYLPKLNTTLNKTPLKEDWFEKNV